MVIAFGISTSLTSVLVLSVISTLVRSQAPNDKGSHSCMESPVPDGVFRLLDSSWYSLLSATSGDTAGWTMTPTDSWTEAGSFCSRRLMSCDSTGSNWLVTQYISKSAQPSYALGITVDLNGEVSYDCIQDSSCSNAVSVYYYPSNGPITTGQQLITNNYQSIGSVSFGYTTETKSLTFSLGSEFDRFYIAIKEENSCFTLRKLQVSYGVCSSMEDGLVVYPDTPIGSSNVLASASCKANAAVSPGSSLDITCNTDGTFSGSPSCSCQAGYIGATCFACAAGSYAEFGDTTCTSCPANSNSEKGASSCYCNANFYKNSGTCMSCPTNSMSGSGSTSCNCNANYYRALADSITDACTTGPNAPTDPMNTSVTNTSVSLTWTAPTSNGGRSDGFIYKIGYKASGAQEFMYYSSTPPITGTSATVPGLSPTTMYTFVVVAGNAVTEENPDDFLLPDSSRTSSELTVITKASPPEVTVAGEIVLVWKGPKMCNGDITGYQIKVTRMSGDTKNVIVGNTTFYYEPEIPNSENGTMTLQVRGINSGGYGDWSVTQEISYNSIGCAVPPQQPPSPPVCITSTSTDALPTVDLMFPPSVVPSVQVSAGPMETSELMLTPTVPLAPVSTDATETSGTDAGLLDWEFSYQLLVVAGVTAVFSVLLTVLIMTIITCLILRKKQRTYLYSQGLFKAAHHYAIPPKVGDIGTDDKVNFELNGNEHSSL